MWCQIFVGLLLVNAVCCFSPSGNVTERHKQGFKWNSEELLTKRFPRKISQDVDLDPCKAGIL